MMRALLQRVLAALALLGALSAAAQPPGDAPTGAPPEAQQLVQWRDQARAAITDGDYDLAIRLCTKLLDTPEHPYRQEAQEYLGLARERIGQTAHAKAEYQRYLALYPQGEGAERVRQRLAALITAAQPPRMPLREVSAPEQRAPWQVYGAFSQYYRRDVSRTDALGETVDQSALFSDLDVTARRRGEDYDLRTRFNGGYRHDLLGGGAGGEMRVNNLYLDVARGGEYSARLGRQSATGGGVLGRFDGMALGYRLSPRLRLNLLSGLPVESSAQASDPDRYFYGLGVDLGSAASPWSFNGYTIEQRIDGILDRRAVGGEARYAQDGRSLFGLLDYDISYSDLNIALLSGSLTLANQTSVNFTLDYRNSPILTSSNALQGQAVDSVAALLHSYSEAQLRALAQDRTALSRTASLGVTHPLGERLQLGVDASVSHLTATPASGGVAATPSTGREYFLSTQLTASELFTAGDTSLLGLRYSDTSGGESVSLFANSRLPWGERWRFGPRAQLDFRRSDAIERQWTFAPALRVEYRWARRYLVELDTGYEQSSRKLTDQTERSSAYFVNLGFRAEF